MVVILFIRPLKEPHGMTPTLRAGRECNVNVTLRSVANHGETGVGVFVRSFFGFVGTLELRFSAYAISQTIRLFVSTGFLQV
jgi:hypothetical protein